jgi:sodium-dependent dicarboxylate transporter 2/3/5
MMKAKVSSNFLSLLGMTAKHLKLITGPLAALFIYFFCDLSPGNPLVTKMAAITVWMALWWLTEVVHLAVTALLPILMLPLLGIADSKTVASQYMDPIIFLFIGGFIIAFAIERWNLHQRVALKILTTVGSSPRQILLGIMLTAFLISMWISNTATVMMLISVVMAVILQIEKHFAQEEESRGMATALLIGLAYSANIGGMATLVGTPTNMIFLREYNEKFPSNSDMNFFAWFKFGFPLALVLLAITYFMLRYFFVKKGTQLAIEKGYFNVAYKNLGKISFEEKAVGTVFFITALLWFTRADIDFGLFKMKGWSNLFINKDYIHDSTVAILMAMSLFFIPSKNEKGRPLLVWDDVTKLPFDIVLLFGGGFALAKGFELSGLSDWLGTKLNFSSNTPVYLLLLALCLLVVFISEFASNVACIQLMLPILLVMYKPLNVHPLLLMIPATLSASLGFMLPVATAPNTIVFASKRIRSQDMMKAGLIMDLAGVIVIVLTMMLLF